MKMRRQLSPGVCRELFVEAGVMARHSVRGGAPAWYTPVLVATVILAAVIFRFALSPERLAPAAADFSLAQLLDDSQSVRLSDYRGQLVILNFFASWCGPCRQEMPLLEATYQRYVDRGLVVIGIGSMDGKRPLTGFVLSMGISFPVVWDKLGKVMADHDVRSLPTTRFIDRQGNIQATIVGRLDNSQIDAWLQTME